MMGTTTNGIRTDICEADGNQICYIILPMQPSLADLEWMKEYAKKFSVCLVILSGIDWNNDMTPWPAPALRSGESGFEGRAEAFLQTLLNDVITATENDLKRYDIRRTLIGVSLSGLFSLWAGCRTDAFSMTASISGSFWYDGFTDWLMQQTPFFDRAFLLLGDKEKKARNPRMAVVEEQTQRVNEIFHGKGIECTFELDSGTHFSPFLPRLERALRHLFEDAVTL